MTRNLNITVRPVIPEDHKNYASAAHEMIVEAFRSPEGWTSDGHIVGIDRITLEGVNELIDNSGKSGVFLFAFDKDVLVGCILICEDGLLSMLSVSLKYQSQGIGGLLIKESTEYMKSVLLMKMAIVHVFQCRPELLTWYQRIGFKDNNEVIPFPVKDILLVDEAPLVVLRKPLL